MTLIYTLESVYFESNELSIENRFTQYATDLNAYHINPASDCDYKSEDVRCFWNTTTKWIKAYYYIDIDDIPWFPS